MSVIATGQVRKIGSVLELIGDVKDRPKLFGERFLLECFTAKLGQMCEDVLSCTKVVNRGPSVVKDLVTTFDPPVQIGITNFCSPQERCRCDPRDLVSLDVERA